VVLQAEEAEEAIVHYVKIPDLRAVCLLTDGSAQIKLEYRI
jgi:hypothetical protein